jgi:hypothetical protein
MRQLHPVRNRRIEYCVYIQHSDKGQEIANAPLRRAAARWRTELRRTLSLDASVRIEGKDRPGPTNEALPQTEEM